MADLISGASAVTQWGIGFANACGEAALAVVFGVLSGQPPTPADVAQLVREGARFGVDATGVSTPAALQGLAASRGVTLNRGPGGAAALDMINSNLAQGYPTILEVTNASAFGGHNAGVQGHFVTVVGRNSSGNYVVDDSNQQAALSGQPVLYSAKQIMQAQPYATLTPARLPFPGINIGMNGTPAAGAVNTWFSGLVGGIGAKSGPDLLWRGGLIVGGMVLVVVGILIFFSRQETEVVTTVVGQAKTAAKAATAAAG